MKTTACIKLLALLLLTACDRTSKLSFEGGAPGGVHTIADLKARCTANSVAVTEDITLEGVVTATISTANFTRRSSSRMPAAGFRS